MQKQEERKNDLLYIQSNMSRQASSTRIDYGQLEGGMTLRSIFILCEAILKLKDEH